MTREFKYCAAAVAVLVGLVFVQSPKIASAAVIPLNLAGADFNALGNWSAVGTPLVVPMTQTVGTSTISGQVTSQAFYDSQQSSYLYLYQVTNTGGAGDHIIEIFSIYPFTGANGSTQAGHVTTNLPTGFTLGTQGALGATVDTSTADGATISFGFYAYLGWQIDTGEVSKTLYVRSDLPPTIVLGNLIDGGIAQGSVVGPVPEPAMLGLLGIGAVLFVRRRG